MIHMILIDRCDQAFNFNVIDINGLVQALRAIEITVDALEVTNGTVLHHVDCGYIDCTGIGTNTGNVLCGGTVDTEYLKVADTSATWQSATVKDFTNSSIAYFLYNSTGGTTATGSSRGYILKSVTSKTIHYLGSATT